MSDTQVLPSSASRLETWAEKIGVSTRTLVAGMILPIVALIAVGATLFLAPPEESGTIVVSTLIAVAAGLASASVGVYGGVLVPGLLLLGIDARFVAALSLFLQIGVIPIAAGSHYRLGHVSRSLVVPLLIGGVVGAFGGPFFAALLPKELIARFVAILIIVVGGVVLANQRLRGLGHVRAEDDVPTGRVAGIGLVAGFSSGVSGAGWGPLGVTSLILSRIDPRQAVGSSLFARIFMAISAVGAFLIAQAAFHNVTPNWWIVVPLFFGSIAPMIPAALLLSRLGRERATVAITLLSVALALPTLIWGH